MINSIYYISSGGKNCFYTLRYRFEEMVGTSFVERDYFVRNLSIDKETAIQKVKELYNRDVSVDFDLNDISRRDEVDHSIFQAGKYTGCSIHEVKEKDPNYLIWICENLQNTKGYVKTVELVKVLMKHEIALKEQKTKEAQQARWKNRAERYERLKYIVEVLQAGNEFYISLAEQLLEGPLSDRQSQYVMEGFRKMKGLKRKKDSDLLDKVYDDCCSK